LPIHCASYCFAKHTKYIGLVGGHFKRHGTGTFVAKVVRPEHPTMRGFQPFEAWDETYEHDRLSDDREVLMVYDDGRRQEPWTWTRTQGRGRVFYTASGHDDRCWRNPGFLNLIERGIRWAAGNDPSVAGSVAMELSPAARFPVPTMVGPQPDAAAFSYAPAKVAFYPPGGARKGDGAWNKMQLPLAPRESMTHLSVPEGFGVELFAAEPEIGKPICMSWDIRGRLWIAETVDYPNELQPAGAGRDRIRICEDTDGDGRADKFTVFAEKLSIPTSLTFARGGVVVHQAPDTLFLRDTSGDDVADERRVLFSGWGTGDTHAGPSNLVYGLDNWLWGMVGYSAFDGTVGGEPLKFKQGFYRFRPDGSKLEFLRSTNNNTWGIGISEEGLVFGSTANHNPSVYMPVPNRYYEAVRGWSAEVLGTIADTHLFHAPTDKIRQVDHHGGYTAAAGHALYTARTFPQPYWNQAAFVTEPTGHLVGTFVLNREGSDFHSTNPFNLLASDDEWTAPIMAEVGPDGHVWVIDWYNYIVQHNPTPVGFETGKGAAYETELRDKKHGRIYRVVYRGAGKSEPVDLRDAAPEQLVATLAHPNLLWRRHAQRLLVERAKRDVVPALVELADDDDVDAIGLNVGVIHALWTLHGLGALDGSDERATAVALEALAHRSAGVRRNAVQVLPRTSASTAAILKARLLDDTDAQVRLATLLALAELPADREAGAAVAAALVKPENSTDAWIPVAATAAGAAHDRHFLQAMASAAEPVPERAIGAVRIVAEHVARGPKSSEAVGPLFVALAAGNARVAEAAIVGLARGWQKGPPVELSAEAGQATIALVKKLSPAGQSELINLAERLGSTSLEKYATEISSALLATALDPERNDAERIAAIGQVAQFRGSDAKVLEQLLELVSPRSSPELAVGVVEALSASRSATVGPALVERLAALSPAARASALRVLISRSDWILALLAGAEHGQASLAELSLDQKQALAAHPDKQIAARVRKLLASDGSLPDANRQKVLEQLLSLCEQTGNVERGKQVFIKQCSKCHTHTGLGNKIGPDLTGMAVHPKAELLTNIIDPSRSVEGNYRVYSVVTDDGRVLSGLLASETKTSIELVDAEGKKTALQRDAIEQLAASRKSLMPEGFEKLISTTELADLLEFLTARGKYLPLPLHKVATVVTTRPMFHKDANPNGADQMIFADWGPKAVHGVPFQLIDPRGQSIANAVLLYGPSGTLPPSMPRSVKIPCNAPARAIHLLSGVSGWGYPASRQGSVSMIVRLEYADGTTEDHPLVNGEHFADYIRRVDVPKSEFAFALRGQQLRYLAVLPKQTKTIRQIELLKGPDGSSPIVMAATVEGP